MNTNLDQLFEQITDKVSLSVYLHALKADSTSSKDSFYRYADGILPAKFDLDCAISFCEDTATLAELNKWKAIALVVLMGYIYE